MAHGMRSQNVARARRDEPGLVGCGRRRCSGCAHHRTTHLADPRRQGRRQRPGAHHCRRARLAVPGQGARVPGALCPRQAALSHLALSRRSGTIGSSRAAVARSDPDRRAPPLDGGAVGQGTDARRGHAGRGRPPQTLARPLRSGDRAAAVPAAPPRQCAAPGSALDACRRGRDRRCQRGMAQALRRPAAAAHRSTGRRADQAVPVRSGGRQAADGARPARRRGRGRLTLREHQPPDATRGGRGPSRESCRPAPASTGGTTAAPTPTTRCSGWPTGSSSPATASR